jgi:asparagine synthase (glutamine-hydrolysing)
MISDVPLGAFLSGGIDSSVVVALASKHVHKLETFSIGFKDNPFFDETAYADLVAKKYQTNHHEIILGNKDLFDHIFDVLEYIDEPFADSSALAVYVLSHETRKHVKVALSGDGADEIFAGYNKYWANIKIENANTLTKQLVHFKHIAKLFPASRSGNVSNKIRQIQKFIEGLSLDPHKRFIRFCAINTEKELEKLFHEDFKNKLVHTELENIEKELCHQESEIVNTNDVLWRDQQMVLPNDMLVKIDLMSMANSLEVRSPFLDHRVGEFANSLPENYKIDTQMKKKIVQDAFREILPEQLYNRPKKGFDVPLMDWFKTELHSYIFDELLEESFISEQKIFDYQYIIKLKQRLFSNNPQDAQAQIWALLVFQYWYKKRFK